MDMVLNNYLESFLKSGRPCDILCIVLMNKFKNHIFGLLRPCKSTKSWIKIDKLRVHWSVYKMNTNNLNQVCCCCWRNLVSTANRSALLTQLWRNWCKFMVIPATTRQLKIFRKVDIWSTCSRNLYLLKQGKEARKSWGEKIAKVHTILHSMQSNIWEVCLYVDRIKRNHTFITRYKQRGRVFLNTRKTYLCIKGIKMIKYQFYNWRV